MRIYIPATRHATLMLFKRGNDADEARADAIEAKREDIKRRIFDSIITGAADEAHQRFNNGYNLIITHRSTRHEGIQQSHFALINGTWEATSHHDAHSAADIEIKSGYITITANA